MILDKHLGVVLANENDPLKKYGVQCRVDTLVPDFAYPEWFYPIFPSNSIKIPDIGQIIEVMVVADTENDSGDFDLGTVRFSEYAYYTGRIFDEKDGVIPNDLKTNYPKRSSVFWAKDGTIVFYDETKNNKEFSIYITDKQTYLQLKEDEVTLQQGTGKMVMKGGKLTITIDETELGAAGAGEAMILGTKLVAYLNSVESAFGSAHTHSCPSGGGPSGPPNPVMPSVPNDLESIKHKLDQ
jgi:hypothetical protein